MSSFSNTYYVFASEGETQMTFWTSGMYSFSQSTWIWKVGTLAKIPFSYMNWKKEDSEPLSTTGENNCMALVITRSSLGTYTNKWVVKDCRNAAHIICKTNKKCN